MGEMPNDDLTLLREYAERNSEEAFAAVVSRYDNLVYSVAAAIGAGSASGRGNHPGGFHHPGRARQDSARREDHFKRLALPHTARYASANALTMQRRRQRREQEAYVEYIS